MRQQMYADNARGVVGGEASYSEARAEAERIISEARSGRDPFIGIALLRNADISTFEGLSERFLADPAPGRKGRVFSEATRAGLTRIVRKELIPAWGRRDPNYSAAGAAALGQGHRGREPCGGRHRNACRHRRGTYPGS